MKGHFALHFALWLLGPDGLEHHTGVSLDDQEYDTLKVHLEALQAGGYIADYTLDVPATGDFEDVLEELDEFTGTEACRTCSKRYDTYGDGYDGECPECADKTADKKELTQEQED